MATYFLSYVDGTDGNTGADWANAVKTLKYAVETLAATGGPHIIKWDSASVEVPAADTTVTLAQDIYLVSVNRASSDALLAGVTYNRQATNYGFTLTGGFELYCYGVTFGIGTGGTNKTMTIGNTSGGHYEFESCGFSYGTHASMVMQFGPSSATQTHFTRLINCTITRGAAGQTCRLLQYGEALNLTLAGTAPTSAFISNSSRSSWRFVGCDLSVAVSTLFADTAGNAPAYYMLANCKLGSGVVIKAAQTSVLNGGGQTVYAVDCAAGDTHYSLYHGDPYGETTESSAYYYTSGGASINSGFSWKIVTTANCSFWNPYVSPWFSKAHTGTSAVTLSIEGLRLSTTVIQDDEVWGEFSYKGTSGQSIATLANDRQGVGARANGTAGADQTSGVTHTAWTNGTASHSAFKLATASTVTPAEIGVLRARVVVGEPSLTVYIDPQVRVA